MRLRRRIHSLAFTPQTSDIVPCHPLRMSPTWGRNHTISSKVHGASGTFTNTGPFGYEYVHMCVSACACVCVCPRCRQKAQKDSLSFVGGFLVFPFSFPLLIHSSCSFRTFQPLLSMLRTGGWKERSLVHRKSGWSPAEAWTLAQGIM